MSKKSPVRVAFAWIFFILAFIVIVGYPVISLIGMESFPDWLWNLRDIATIVAGVLALLGIAMR